jgi:hypothetical protein
VERPVNGCTQAFHRNAETPLYDRRKIVDMIGPGGVSIAAPSPCWMWQLALFFGCARVDRAVELVFL